jgi:glycosyltransferase involved in cell wall biosynthesis
MPIYDDWESAELLVAELGNEISARGERIGLVLVNDHTRPELKHFRVDASVRAHFAEIIIVNLRRNLGHQRAIAIGLSWIHEHLNCKTIVVMDADGEDKPGDVPRLLDMFAESGGSSVIFAERFRRAESLQFQFFYHFYRLLHRVLTGISVRVGNFSVLSFEHLSTLVAVSELWNHYAAAVFKSRLPYRMLRTTRGRRIAGHPQMNFVSLVTHGLSAISVFGETVGVRLMLGAGVASLLLITVLVAVVVIRLTTTLAIPGWATYTGGLLIVALLNVITLAIALTLLVLASRNNMSFVPMRDYSWFVKDWERVTQ